MGVRNPCNGDSCGDGLEDGRSGEDDEEGEESATIEGRRAMSVSGRFKLRSQDKRRLYIGATELTPNSHIQKRYANSSIKIKR